MINKARSGILFLFIFLIDQFSKAHVPALNQWHGQGLFHFEFHQNTGFILQTLTETSVMARIVFVSSLYGFIFFFYLFIQSLLISELKLFRMGLTLLFASVTGNCYDRAIAGGVNDFICLEWAQNAVYFNFADMAMWLGVVFTIYALVRDRDLIWHPDSKRKKYLVNKKFQFKFAAQATFVAFSIALVLILFSYTFIVHVIHAVSASGNFSGGYVYLMSVTPLALLFLLMTFFAAVVFSHRIAGPIYALTRYIERLQGGEADATLRLRKSDEHQELGELADKIKQLLKD